MNFKNPLFALLLLCVIYNGPRSFGKHGIADFGNFIVIFLILAKVNAVNAANGFTVFHDKFPQGSVMMIETFLRIFPLLTPRQKDVLDKFISDDDVDAFLCEHFGDNWMQIFHKYEDTFRVILPRLFRYGLSVSPNYKGRYACSTAKWVVAKMIFWLMERYTCRPKDDPNASPSSQTTEFAIAIMRDYRHNVVFQLYLETMVQMELTNDPKFFKHANREFRNIIVNQLPHYEAWLQFIAEIEKRTHVHISPNPKDWDSKLICWLMNSFQSYEILSQYMSENPAKN
jgi:hypothetical protein